MWNVWRFQNFENMLLEVVSLRLLSNFGLFAAGSTIDAVRGIFWNTQVNERKDEKMNAQMDEGMDSWMEGLSSKGELITVEGRSKVIKNWLVNNNNHDISVAPGIN